MNVIQAQIAHFLLTDGFKPTYTCINSDMYCIYLRMIMSFRVFGVEIWRNGGVYLGTCLVLTSI